MNIMFIYLCKFVHQNSLLRIIVCGKNTLHKMFIKWNFPAFERCVIA